MQLIANRVQQIVADHLGIDVAHVRTDADLSADLGADSMDRIDLLMACEDEFAIEIPDRDAEQFRTVNDVVQYIAARAAAV